MPGSLVFGPFRLDRDAGALLRGETPVPLAPRPFALLSYLADHPGRLISKDDLLQAVWPGVFVGDAALKVAIREIRKALDDPAQAPVFIETIHGRGYRFRAGAIGTRLPAPLTSFVGREAELEALRAALATSRLVTLHGPGGAGKTRLARQIAADLQASVADGVWWVDLAGIDRSDLVVPALAATFGIRDRRDHALDETLSDFVRPRALLLVLDNCEHVLAGCAPIVERLLGAGPSAVILTTSRQPLGIPGERVLLVPPLALPPEDAEAGAARAAEAVRLFVERAQDADPTFAWTPAVASTVAAICRHLDGLPLAIELVASRVAALSPGDILRQLEKSLSAVKGSRRRASARHDSPEAAINWSYDLLAPAERRFLQQLSVFAGSFSLAAVQGICDPAGERASPDLVAALVNKSLVTAVDGGPGHQRRYRLLEIVRQFAREKMPEAERTRLADRHAEWFATRAETHRPLLNGPERTSATAALVADRDNLRAALGGSLTANPPRALRLASSLWWWWFHTNQWREGRDWLEAALERSPADDVTRAEGLCGAGALAWFQGDTDRARLHLEQAVALARTLDARQVLARSLDFLGQLRADLAELDGARACAVEAVAIARARGDRWELAVALIGLGNVLSFVGDESAAAHYEESVSLCRAMVDPWLLGMGLRNLGIVARRRGDLEESIRRLRDSLRALSGLDDQWFVSRSLEELAATLTQAGEARRAAMLFGAAEALREAVGAAVLAVRYAEYAKALSQLRAALGDSAFADAWVRGRSLARDHAIGLALRKTGPSWSASHSGSGRGPLPGGSE